MTHPLYTAFTAYGVPMIRHRTGCCWRVVWRESQREAA